MICGEELSIDDCLIIGSHLNTAPNLIERLEAPDAAVHAQNAPIDQRGQRQHVEEVVERSPHGGCACVCVRCVCDEIGGKRVGRRAVSE